MNDDYSEPPTGRCCARIGSTDGWRDWKFRCSFRASTWRSGLPVCGVHARSKLLHADFRDTDSYRIPPRSIEKASANITLLGGCS